MDDLKSTQNTDYPTHYSPQVLHRIDRATQRHTLSLTDARLPFNGQDTWFIYELSWLDPDFKPKRRVALLTIDCQSPYLIESKSLKLYFFSLNQTVFANDTALKTTISNDLSQCLGAKAQIELYELKDLNQLLSHEIRGHCIDHHHPSNIDFTKPQANLIKTRDRHTVHETTLYSHLFRSLCPITQQPDWASVIIHYQGAPLDEQHLLTYLLSYRNHGDFHEHCIEKIFMDLYQHQTFESLSVLGCFYRRGGISINPYRSTSHEPAPLAGLHIQ